MIIGVDPGTTKSAFVTLDNGIENFGILENEQLKHEFALFGDIDTKKTHTIVIEQVEHYGTGMPVGKSVFETVFWSGRFWEAWYRFYQLKWMPRRHVKLALCGSARAKDSNIRQAIIDKFPPVGGGKTPQIGTKNEPGPLYGIKSHCWAALALAITYQSIHFPLNLSLNI